MTVAFHDSLAKMLFTEEEEFVFDCSDFFIRIPLVQKNWYCNFVSYLGQGIGYNEFFSCLCINQHRQKRISYVRANDIKQTKWSVSLLINKLMILEFGNVEHWTGDLYFNFSFLLFSLWHKHNIHSFKILQMLCSNNIMVTKM